MNVVPHFQPNSSHITLPKNQTVIYVVDMINGFCHTGALADQRILEIVPAIASLCEQAAADKRYFIADTHEVDAIEFKAFPTHCLKDSFESEVVAGLRDYVTQPIITKNSTNAFHAMDHAMMPFLDDDIQHIVITGCCTDICVLQFALSLKTYLNQHNLNKRMMVPMNCVATYHNLTLNHDGETFHAMALHLMQQAGIEVIGDLVLN